MKLCKAKTWLPLSAAMITVVSSPVGTAFIRFKRMIP
ncbi:Protein of unknown function [Bacillus wiedmannii]|nr:Protein of unknown function [Bacillus wiedmannii]